MVQFYWLKLGRKNNRNQYFWTWSLLFLNALYNLHYLLYRIIKMRFSSMRNINTSHNVACFNVHRNAFPHFPIYVYSYVFRVKFLLPLRIQPLRTHFIRYLRTSGVCAAQPVTLGKNFFLYSWGTYISNFLAIMFDSRSSFASSRILSNVTFPLHSR